MEINTTSMYDIGYKDGFRKCSTDIDEAFTHGQLVGFVTGLVIGIAIMLFPVRRKSR